MSHRQLLAFDTLMSRAPADRAIRESPEHRYSISWLPESDLRCTFVTWVRTHKSLQNFRDGSLTGSDAEDKASRHIRIVI